MKVKGLHKKISFSRITSSGSFIPEIDGLRFLAVASVVLFHLNGYLEEKVANEYFNGIDYSFLAILLRRGYFGVNLFFVISGFVVALPFAKCYIKGKQLIGLKQYFLRRITRLVPPYVVVMTGLMFASVYFAGNISLAFGIKSYLASLVYSHNILYNERFILNPVIWSLEIEVQFYILAPLMAKVFSVNSALIRRLSMIAFILAYPTVIGFVSLPFPSLIDFIEYFLVGFLLADVYVSEVNLLPRTSLDFLIGLLCLAVIWIFEPSNYKYSTRILLEMIQIICIFWLFYYVLFHKVFKFLTVRLITDLGGMCYSIYLVHYAIISVVGKYLLKYTLCQYVYMNTA